MPETVLQSTSVTDKVQERNGSVILLFDVTDVSHQSLVPETALQTTSVTDKVQERNGNIILLCLIKLLGYLHYYTRTTIDTTTAKTMRKIIWFLAKLNEIIF